MDETITAEIDGAEDVEKQIDDLTEKDTVEKSQSGVVFMATSFAELDEMEDAAERVEDVREMAETFSIISMNIMTDPMIEDKGAALTNLANEFKARVSSETKEIEDTRHKEIEHDDTLVKAEDFQGGCKVCGFGEPELTKELGKCSFCHNEV